MNTVEKIFEEARLLPETEAREVLDFIGYLKHKHVEKKIDTDMTEFDRYGLVFDGRFDRDECYDRQGIR